MNKFLPPALFFAMTVFISPASAQVITSQLYADPTGDIFTDAGEGILDITGVEVSHTATDLIFHISLAGDPVATNWGKYMIGFDTVAGSGATAGNGWGRPIDISSGMDFWVGTWVDGAENTTGGQLYDFGTEWTLQSQQGGTNPANLNVAKDASSVTVQLSLASLGLSSESTFNFDIYTSGGGGGDGAIDASSNSNQSIADWSNLYDSGTNLSTYAIPEPSTYAAIFGGLALLAAFGYRRCFGAKR